MNKLDDMVKLISLLNAASDRYYNYGDSQMSDQEWDQKFDKLKRLEQENGIVLSNSPTANVGYTVQSSLSKVEHKVPLLSLGKTKNIDDVIKFIGDQDIIAMLKGDGLTHELDYQNGNLIQASTRGNGYIGEDVTYNARVFKNIPLHITYKGNLKVSGEAVIYNQDFDFIRQNEDTEYANSRNLVAGTVRNLDPHVCARRNVRFLAFNIVECDENFATVYESFDWLQGLGFTVIPYVYFSDLNSYQKNEQSDVVETKISQLKECAHSLGIPFDGIVFKYNDIKYGLSLGTTAHHPQFALAFKFRNEENPTTYDHTEWQVGRTGVITPVAIFHPIEIEGSTVSRATLHNVDYFEDLQLGHGDQISVIKANEVIPKVTDNLTRSNTEKVPHVCPICRAETEIKTLKTARVLICPNENCPSRKIAQLVHFCSRNCMDVQGLSEATLTTFINTNLLHTFSDIYRLAKYRDIITSMDGFSDKSYAKLMASIEKSKQVKAANFLFALGIPSIGLGTAKLIAKRFHNDIDAFMKAVENCFDFSVIENIGIETNRQIYLWFDDFLNYCEVKQLLDIVNIDNGGAKQDNILEGKIFVITGDVHIYSNRSKLQEKIEQLGGKTSSSVSSKTDYLIANQVSNSSKFNKAREFNVPVINEERFQEMIGE